MSKRMVHCYSTDETINQFAIGFIINPSINCNKLLRVQVEKCLNISFTSRKMEIIRYCLKNENTCVMALITIYDNNGENTKKCIVCSVVFLLSHKQLCLY